MGISSSLDKNWTFISPGQRHASEVNVGLDFLQKESGLLLTNLDAIAVSKGPGSYTGLRVGVAFAKALCVSLGLPLLGLDTLEVILYAAKNTDNDYYFTSIDARRQEVFAAIWDHNKKKIEPTQAIILNESEIVRQYSYFDMGLIGSGSEKSLPYFSNGHLCVYNEDDYLDALALLSRRQLENNTIEDVVNFAPEYGKDAFVTQAKKKL